MKCILKHEPVPQVILLNRKTKKVEFVWSYFRLYGHSFVILQDSQTTLKDCQNGEVYGFNVHSHSYKVDTNLTQWEIVQNIQHSWKQIPKEYREQIPGNILMEFIEVCNNPFVI